ncbi:hypothetical protein SH467x_001236 [Pirellulaceae bacterium SH467]
MGNSRLYIEQRLKREFPKVWFSGAAGLLMAYREIHRNYTNSMLYLQPALQFASM